MAEEDLIYGKNRHMFGGAEPSNMIEFSARINENSKIEIIAKPPKDTIIDGQTLCSVAGAIIRRKSGNYPKDEFDGTLVTTVTEDVTFTDAEADQAGTWYYSAFPYSIQGVYNRNPINRCMVNEPERLTSFTATYKYVSSSDSIIVTLNAGFSKNIHGVMIRKSTTGYPLDENDGSLLSTIYSPGEVLDEDVVAGIKYFYSAFPFTSTGEYNRDLFNRVSLTPRKASYYFGFDLDMDDSNPDTRVTYPDDVDNANFEPAGLNDVGLFSLRDWNFKAGEKFMPRPCLLSNDGVVLHYLDENNYSKDADTGETVNIGYNSKGQVMIEWPKIYTKRWQEGNIYKFRCSDAKLDEDYDCWCNYDINDNEIEHFYMSAYNAYWVERRNASDSDPYYLYDAMSRSGAYLYDTSNDYNEFPSGYKLKTATANIPTVNVTLQASYGDIWNSECIAERSLIYDLLIMLSCSSNLEKKYGYGYEAYIYGENYGDNIKTGVLDEAGLFRCVSGASDYRMPGSLLKVFGMENYWERTINKGGSAISGLFGSKANDINAEAPFSYKITPGMHDGTSKKGFGVDNTGYLIGKSIPVFGYVKKMDIYPFGRLPSDNDLDSASSSTATTYDCAVYNYYVNNNAGMCQIGMGLRWGSTYNAISAYSFCNDYKIGSAIISDGGEYFFRISCRPKAK